MNQLHKKHDITFVLCLAYLFFCSANEAALEPSSSHGPKSHFVLVHGSGHGAWCWYKLVTLLRSSGERVTALDLSASGIDTQVASTLRSVSDYFQPLTDFMTALPMHERVILVGHSFGGYALTQSMELFPEKISAAVFVTAFMPGPTLNISVVTQGTTESTGSLLDSTYAYDNGTNNPPTTLLFGPLFLATKLYQLSPIDDYELAKLLVRPQRQFSVENLSQVIRPSKERYGSVKRVFIISGNDKALLKGFQEFMVKRNPPNEVLMVNGSDHMVMFSQPTKLWGLLLRIAHEYS